MRAAEQQQQAALEKPIDLFKAIFEDDDSSDEADSDDNTPPDKSVPTMGPVSAPAAISAMPLSPGHQPEHAASLQQDTVADQPHQQHLLSQARLHETYANVQQASAAEQQLKISDADNRQNSVLLQQQGRSSAHASAVVGEAGRESESDSQSDVDRGKADKKHKHKRDSRHKHRKSKHTKKHKSEKHKGSDISFNVR